MVGVGGVEEVGGYAEWRAEGGRRYAGHAGAVTAVRVADDGSRVVSVGDDGAVLLWRVVPAAGEGVPEV